MADGPYARVYWSIVDDREFAGIYDDDAALALWLRLLLIADQAWPTSAHLPKTARVRPLEKLTKAGLVRISAGGRYTVRGMDAERGKRQQKARNAAALRWHSDSNAPGNAQTMPSRAEQSKDKKEPPQPPAELRLDPRGPLLTKAQFDSWASFGSEWSAFREAWIGRGLLFAPYGTEEDDETSQRGMLYRILDARPTDMVRWIKEAPPRKQPKAREVIAYILERWHQIQDEALPTVPEPVVHGPNRKQAMEVVGSILSRMPVAK